MDNNNILTSLNLWIEEKSKIRLYHYYLAFLLMVCSLMFASPHYSNFDLNSVTWETILLKSNDLTNSLSHIDPAHYLSKKVFRLTLPLIIKITQLPPAGILIMQYIVGVFLIVFCYKLSLKILKDPVSSTYVAAGIVFLYFGRTSFYDISAIWFDGFAYFFLILAMYFANPFLIFLFSSAAAWTDERGFVALIIVLLFQQIKSRETPTYSLSSLIKLNSRSITVVFAMIFYVALRIYLSYKFNMQNPTGGVSLATIKKTQFYMSIGVWTFLEGFWLIFLATLIYSLKNKTYLFSIIMVGIFMVFTVISFSVTDITRSGSYMVPLLFVLLFYLYNNLQKKELRSLLFVCLAIVFIFPPMFVCSDWEMNGMILHPTFILILKQILMS